jgi:sulfur carrier protein
VIKIRLNGKEQQVPVDMTVTGLLLRGKIRPELVTVEVNGSVLQKLDYDHTVLRGEDDVEVVFYMGGSSGGSCLQGKKVIDSKSKPFNYFNNPR